MKKNKFGKISKKNQLVDRSFLFSKEIITFVSSFPNSRLYWVISDQLLRSATSIGANIVEAQAGSSKKDFTKFFQIALKSANETHYWLRLLKESTTLNKKTIDQLIIEVEEISKMLAASLITLKKIQRHSVL